MTSASQPQDRARAANETPAIAAVPLHLVLVEPQIPPNTGNVARLCAATGCRLHLVEPLGFAIDDRALKRAGLDYWSSVDLHVHASLAAALAVLPAPPWLFSAHAAHSYAHADFAAGDALVFGKETAGLPRALVAEAGERALRIPMRPGAVRSLNLSTAVGIVAYAALARAGFPGLT